MSSERIRLTIGLVTCRELEALNCSFAKEDRFSMVTPPKLAGKQTSLYLIESILAS